ncbi:MAG TPA: hypothetical protein VNT51_09770 [Miltoncostaeaceae bacterium]|nr:hypothetical protein [Miltoncostaeaceae bacterium]
MDVTQPTAPATATDDGVEPLPTGAALRRTGPADAPTVLMVNGGSAADVPGTWSPSLEWLVDHLAPRFPDLGFVEVRYRTRSWKRLDSCIRDGRAALAAVRAAGAPRVCMLGFSMGGGVALTCAADPAVRHVVGLAPWVPPSIDLAPLRGARVAVFHGSIDGFLPGIPGVSPGHSHLVVKAMHDLGVDARHTLIRGAFHGLALRPLGIRTPLPRARTWARHVEGEIARFAAGGGV